MNITFGTQQPAGNDLSAWLIALAIAVGGIVVARLFYLLSTKGIKRLADRARTRLPYTVVDMLEEPLAVGIAIAGFYWAERRLVLAESVDAAFSKVIAFAIVLDVTWALARLLDDLVTQFVVPAVAKSDSKLDDQLLPIMRNVARVLIWLVGIVVAIDNAGYNVGTIVAGLGIGGLAFAFAAQETIANLFGGVTFFIDSPFVIGDRIKVGGFDGFVREIGLRTSKLETLDGRRLTVPNSFFSKSVIENVSSEPATKILEVVGLSRANDAEKIETALDLVTKVLADEPDLAPGSSVYFGDFGASSFDLTLIFWVKKGADYGAVRSRVNVAVIRALDAARIDLAIPARIVMNS